MAIFRAVFRRRRRILVTLGLVLVAVIGLLVVNDPEALDRLSGLIIGLVVLIVALALGRQYLKSTFSTGRRRRR